MFIDSFMSICQDKGVSPSRALTELKISKGALAQWKSGGEPRNENKKKIADYFGITVKQLMAGEIEKPAVIADNELNKKKEELFKLMEDLSEDNQDKIIELARLYVESEQRSKGKK